jgi:hypothetical protein
MLTDSTAFPIFASDRNRVFANPIFASDRNGVFAKVEFESPPELPPLRLGVSDHVGQPV